MPTTVWPGATSLVTTACAPTVAPSPMVTPPSTTDRCPRKTRSPIVIGPVPWTGGGRRGRGRRSRRRRRRRARSPSRSSPDRGRGGGRRGRGRCGPRSAARRLRLAGEPGALEHRARGAEVDPLDSLQPVGSHDHCVGTNAAESVPVDKACDHLSRPPPEAWSGLRSSAHQVHGGHSSDRAVRVPDNQGAELRRACLLRRPPSSPTYAVGPRFLARETA